MREAAGADVWGALKNPRAPHWVARAMDSAADSTWPLTVMLPLTANVTAAKSTGGRSSMRQ